MQLRLFKQLIVIVIFDSVLLPSFAHGQTGNLQVTQPVSDGAGGDSPPYQDTSAPQVFDVSLTATYNSAVISWATNEISLGKIAWGKNQDYGDGQITVEKYKTKQQAQILQLQPQTQYYFRITAIDQAGNTRVYAGKFLTLAEPDTVGPQNVTGFGVQPMRDRMILSWSNPTDADFAGVRIVRSERFFPLDPFNGQVIYEGAQGFIADSNAVPGKTYYYAIFAKDAAGNYSTGVIGSGMILWYSESQSQYPDAPIVDIKFPQAPGPVQNPANFDDFTIIYNNGSATGSNSNIQIPEGESIKITVPESKLPEGTDSLIITVRDQSNNIAEATYLFAFDKLTKVFFATIPALAAQQSYELVITVFNNAQQILQTIAGSLEIVRNAGDIVIKTAGQIPVKGIQTGIIVGAGVLLGAAVIYQTLYAGAQVAISGVGQAAGQAGAQGSSAASASVKPARPRSARRKPSPKPKLKIK